MTASNDNTNSSPKAEQRVRQTHAQRKAETRSRLLEATWQLFLEHGYEAVTLNAVAERAGYTRTPIHQMFGDKIGLFAGVYWHQVETLRPHLLQQIRDAGSIPELLRLVLERLISLQKDENYLAVNRLAGTVRLLAQEDDGALEQFLDSELKSVERFADRLELLSNKGPALGDLPLRVARRIDNYLTGLQQMAHAELNPIDPDEAINAMLTLTYCQFQDQS